MTTHKREHLRGNLNFDFGYHIEDAEVRPLHFGNGNYKPDYLRFTLTSASREDGLHPRYKDLSTGSIVLHGKKIKKDGTPGLADTSETFYGYLSDDIPDYVTKIIGEAAEDMKSRRDG